MNRRLVTLAIVLGSIAGTAQAFPSFARREGVSCNMCHVNIPRLNRIGYEYRNNGYRFPDNLGKDATPVDFGNFNSAAGKVDFNWSRVSGTEEGGAPASARPANSVQFAELSIWPATGAFGRWLSSSVEVALSPGSVEIEKGYLRFTYGTGPSHLNVRVGVIHPFEGYGATDESLGLSDPIFRAVAPFDRATGTQSFFAPMNFSQAAAEVGYTYGGFNATAAVLNGIVVAPDGSGVDAFIGGDKVRDRADPNYSSKDFQLFANQFFGDAALSAHYYNGRTTQPFAASGGPTTFTNRFERLALYGTVPVLAKLWVLGGAQWGWDRRVDGAGAVLPDRYVSSGWFGEAYVPWNDYVGASVRYDWFDPSRGSGRDLRQGLTVAANLADLKGGQAIVEYRLRDDQTGSGATLKANEVQIRLLYAF